jgi:O-antigen ligase|tara:strand:+ start:209 stop:1456 length:1248 start_codon:yes stop_codon:yes gene_type:complete
MNIIGNTKIIKPFDLVSLIALSGFPLAIIFGNLLINFFIFIFSISFFLNFKENKENFNEKVFYLLIFFFISLLVNVFFSINPENSLPRVIKILFIIFFIYEVKRLIQSYLLTHIKLVYRSWFIIFLILTIDALFEITFGYNLIGNKNTFPGRISSFFGDELVIGAFYHGFALFFLSYLVFIKSKNFIFLTAIISILIISFLIGERSNFIKLFLAVVIFTSLIIKINYKKKIFSILFISLIFLTIINSSESYKARYFDQIIILFTKNGYSNYIKQSLYGAHRNAAKKIFSEHLIFGVGVKNFRHESLKKKYENLEYKETDSRYATHPHQVHYEFLSETGVFGYSCFLIFILSSVYLAFKSYLKTRNLYQLSAIIFITTSLLPLLPSGSFLSTYTSSIFWINFAIMNSYIKELNFKI